MSTSELMKEIRLLSNADRLKLIEAASALVREDMVAETGRRHDDAARRMQTAALEAKELYEPGGELAEWTVLDGEEVFDDSVGGHIKHTVQG